MLFNILAMFAEFEVDLMRMRTREGMKIARAKGRLRGKQPKLNRPRRRTWLNCGDTGQHSNAELAELFSVARSTVYRAVGRAGRPAPAPPRPLAAESSPSTNQDHSQR